jgi:L-ascorbate metabolism protein UlaG (beta-lactamase superfamily)
MNSTNSSTHLTYIGHATILIELDGLRFLTDPILRPRVAHLRRVGGHVSPHFYQNIDAVLISHLHGDHFDVSSLRLIGRETLVIAPKGSGRLLRRFKFFNFCELAMGETITFRGVSITAVYADHSRVRHPLGAVADSLSYILRGRQNVYFAGDTDMFPEMAYIEHNLDVALLPIWGWGPTLGPGHMNPLRAAQALTLLNPRWAVPIHWGTLHPIGFGWFKPNFLSRPPHQFAQHAAQIAPHVQVQIPQPGHPISLREL